MPYYPMASMVWFQCVFASITVILLGGSVLGRMNIKAWMIFVPLWLTFSYTVGAFSIWGGGFLFHWGVMDYSGGYVIHLSSGIAGITAAYWVSSQLISIFIFALSFFLNRGENINYNSINIVNLINKHILNSINIYEKIFLLFYIVEIEYFQI